MGRLDCAAKGAQSATRMKPSNIAIPFARTHTSRFTNSHQREDIDADQGKSRSLNKRECMLRPETSAPKVIQEKLPCSLQGRGLPTRGILSHPIIITYMTNARSGT